MPKPPTMVEEDTRQAPAKTLGDDTKSKALVPEQDWTVLVQSIASGDPLQALLKVKKMRELLPRHFLAKFAIGLPHRNDLDLHRFQNLCKRERLFASRKGAVSRWWPSLATNREGVWRQT